MSIQQEIKIQALSLHDENQTKHQYYKVNCNQKYQIVLNQFLQKINQETKKEYTQLTINAAYGQYVHSHMYIFYVTSNNQQQITICLSIYDFQPGTSHGFIDCILDGHRQIQHCRQILKQQQKWPDGQAYNLSDQNDINQVSNILSNRVDIINQKIELIEEDYKVIRCWTETIEGINYFVHAKSPNNIEITVQISIPEGQQQQQIGGQQDYLINLKCCKGFKTMQEFQEVINNKNQA